MARSPETILWQQGEPRDIGIIIGQASTDGRVHPPSLITGTSFINHIILCLSNNFSDRSANNKKFCIHEYGNF
jgi:hypothetical protein